MIITFRQIGPKSFAPSEYILSKFFLSLCAHKISLIRELVWIWNDVYEICADILGGKIYVRSKFSFVRSSHDVCAAHMHTAESEH